MNSCETNHGPVVDGSSIDDIHCSYLAEVSAFRAVLVRNTDEKSAEETDDAFMDRIQQVYEERFKKDGVIILLPHHVNKRLPVLWESRTSSLGRRGYLLLKEYNVTERRKLDTTMVSEMYPDAVKLDGNTEYDRLYLTDTRGLDIDRQSLVPLALVACMEAMLDTDVPVVLSHDPFRDPFCLTAGVFGGGLHCRAAFIEHAHATTKSRKDKTDLEYMDQWIAAGKEASSKQGDIAWHQPAERSLMSWLKLPHELIFSKSNFSVSFSDMLSAFG